MRWWNPPPDGSDESDPTDLAPDESDVRVRPNPRGSRPRTKVRPAYAEAEAGRVLGIDRGRYAILVAEGTAAERTVIAARARELRSSHRVHSGLARHPATESAIDAIVTGDLVRLVGDLSGIPGSLARIIGVEPRRTLLRRGVDDTTRVERAIVANADQLLIVVAADRPEPRVRLVDRYLVAAFASGIAPMLCVTKTDLADPTAFLDHFAGIDLTVFRSRRGAIPIAELTAALSGHRTVAVGHSGVGKSTLVNALAPAADRATGDVNAVTGRGRHTSSSIRSIRVSGDGPIGWIIDTPGVRSFGLGHIDPAHILASFTDLNAVASDCPRSCNHLAIAPDCAINEALAIGDLGPTGAARVDSLQRLLSAYRTAP